MKLSFRYSTWILVLVTIPATFACAGRNTRDSGVPDMVQCTVTRVASEKPAHFMVELTLTSGGAPVRQRGFDQRLLGAVRAGTWPAAPGAPGVPPDSTGRDSTRACT